MTTIDLKIFQAYLRLTRNDLFAKIFDVEKGKAEVNRYYAMTMKIDFTKSCLLKNQENFLTIIY